MRLKFDWHDASDVEPGFACVFTTDEDGSEDTRIADFYGPEAADRAEAYAVLLNATDKRETLPVTPRLRAVIDDMLAYEQDRFDPTPMQWYVERHGKDLFGPYDTEERATEIAKQYGGCVAPVYGDLNVSGADLVDAFASWREELRECLREIIDAERGEN